VNITIESSTDSPQAVRAALGSMAAPEPVKETKAPTEPNETIAQDAHESAEADGVEESESKEVKDAAAESEEESDAKEGEESEDSEGKDKKPKKKGGYQRKAERFQKEAEARAQEAEYWKQQALKAAGKTEEKSTDAPKVADSSKKPTPDDFETVAEYVEAISDWKVKEAKKEFEEIQKKAQQKTEVDSKAAKLEQNIAKLAESKPDFKELVKDAIEANVRVAPHLEQLLFESDKQAEVYYKLLNDWDLVDKINQSSPIVAAKLFGRLEAEIELESKSDAPKTPEVKTKTTAPTPLKPVGKSAPKTAKNPDDMTYEEFKKWRANNP
jgi:hypothetical protein